MVGGVWAVWHVVRAFPHKAADRCRPQHVAVQCVRLCVAWSVGACVVNCWHGGHVWECDCIPGHIQKQYRERTARREGVPLHR